MEMNNRIMSVTAVYLATVLFSGELSATESSTLKITNNPLTIEGIICEGNLTSDCDFITKKFYQKIGDALDPSEVSDAKLRLGTMEQFRHVDVQLAKGSLRGQVIVVFEVKEANQIQYGFSGSKSKRAKTLNCDRNLGCSLISGRQDSDSNSLSINRTNFNFLGSGKSLSAAVSTGFSNGYSELIDESYNQKDDYRSRGLGLSLGYHDEHFLGSPDYEISGYLSSSINKSESTRSTFYPDSNIEEQEQFENRSKSLRGGIAVSKRFARYSRFIVSTGINLYDSYNGSSLDVDGVSLYYNYDTFNDTLFATRGDQLNTGIRFSDYSKALSVNYARVIPVADDKVINVSLGGNHSMPNSAASSNSLGTSITLKSNQGSDYLYSGWALGVSLSGDDHSGNWEYNKSLYASYTHQTESMTYKFSLGYSN
jgi:hypothetical protein